MHQEKSCTRDQRSSQCTQGANYIQVENQRAIVVQYSLCRDRSRNLRLVMNSFTQCYHIICHNPKHAYSPFNKISPHHIPAQSPTTHETPGPQAVPASTSAAQEIHPEIYPQCLSTLQDSRLVL
jgi:hypothetical protein